MDKPCLHLKKDFEFHRAYAKGKSFVSPSLVTYCLKRKYGGLRIGITTGKKVGNAVRRNRARRVIRAAYSPIVSAITGNWDIVFVARGRTPYQKMQDVQREMIVHLKEAGVLKVEKTDS